MWCDVGVMSWSDVTALKHCSTLDSLFAAHYLCCLQYKHNKQSLTWVMVHHMQQSSRKGITLLVMTLLVITLLVNLCCLIDRLAQSLGCMVCEAGWMEWLSIKCWRWKSWHPGGNIMFINHNKKHTSSIVWCLLPVFEVITIHSHISTI